jgi:hypothetical protein
VAGLIVDLGDLRPDPLTGLFESAIHDTVALIRAKGAIPLMLGGEQCCVASAVAGLRSVYASPDGIAALIISASPDCPLPGAGDRTWVISGSSQEPGHPGGMALAIQDLRQRLESSVGAMLRHFGARPVHVALDASAIASHWHGTSMTADFAGLSLSECRWLFRQLGVANIASLSITGLDPTINGLSLVKTGQRLLLTAILDLIYARLGVLEQRMETTHACR